MASRVPPVAVIASDKVCWAAPRPGVLVTAPDITPTMVGRLSPVIQWMIRVMSTAPSIIAAASRFIVTPPFRKEWKKPGPTCRPMEKTKRMRPKSFMKASTVGSPRRPKWLSRIPRKSIQVVPMDTPLIL